MTTSSPHDPVQIRAALSSDASAVGDLLRTAGLPTAGVEEAFDNFIVAEDAGDLVGAAGLEIHGTDGVLRSVVVAPVRQGTGLGRRLTERILEGARELGLRRVYLLTTTAESYFPRLGFRRIERSAVTGPVLQSVEFREACPASAAVLMLDLGKDRSVSRAAG